MSSTTDTKVSFLVLSIPDMTVVWCATAAYEFPEDELLQWWQLSGLHSISVKAETHTTVVLEHAEAGQRRVCEFVAKRLARLGTVELHTGMSGRQSCLQSKRHE